MKFGRMPYKLTPFLLTAFLVVSGSQSWGQRERVPRDRRESAGNFQANRLLQKGEDLLKAGEDSRGVKMLETVIEQYPDSFERYKAYLALGKHFLDKHREDEAITHFSRLKELKKPDQDLTGEPLDLYLEGLYLTGIAYYRTKQYSAAFPILRRITRGHPNTVWANQSYYYIGMCHFEQENWNKAIEALQLVGTFVDTESENVQFMEAGHRLYLKVQDTDLPILMRLGRTINAEITTSAGDRETVTCVPLSRDGEVVIGSIPTDIGQPQDNQIGDHILQVRGGDTITATYRDDNTQEGEHNVPRLSETRVVSSGTITFTLGTFDGKAAAAFIGQPLFVSVHDADLDVTPDADPASVTLISRYKEKDEEEEPTVGGGIDVDRLLAGSEEEEEYIIRDKVTFTLSERGDAPVHTGDFGGSVELITHNANQPADLSDNRLACVIDDQIIAQYTDELHLGGDHSETRTAAIHVLGEFDSSPRPTQNVVPDALVKARKNLVEGSAFLELAKIFRDMGLMEGAAEKGSEGIDRLDEVIRLSEYIPKGLTETAYQRKWQTQMAVGNYGGALNTCQTFNQLFPDSPLVDQALMEVAKIRMEKGLYSEAIQVFKRILELENSLVKAEALFRIGECTEILNKDKEDENKAMAAAMPIYKRCSTSFPDSEFAGPSLAKQVDYYFKRADFVQANELLEQVFQDYPDADFLDSMLIKWVLVAYRMGDFQKAYEKAQQLVFEYPDSAYAQKAKEFLPKLKARVGNTNGTEADAG